MGVSSHFLGWDKSAVKAAVTRLSKNWDSSVGVLDLSNTIIVVPTLRAGKLLRKELAKFTARQDSAVRPGRVVTPSFFLGPGRDAENMASQAEMLAAWIAVLRNADFKAFPFLFPVPPNAPDDIRWQLGIADRLTGLRSQLGENGLDISDVTAKIGSDDEGDRWADLSRLEAAYFANLSAAGLQDPGQVKRAFDPDGKIGDEVRRVIILGLPDPVPAVISKWESVSKKLEIEVWVHAPVELQDSFDEWGCLETKEWLARSIDLGDDHRVLHAAEKPEDQVDEIMRILGGIGKAIPVDNLSLATLDEELFPLLEKAFSEREIPCFNPAGSPLFKSSVCNLLQALKDLVQTADYQAFATLLRNADFLRFLNWEQQIDSSQLLIALDEFQNDHLPVNLDAIGHFLARDQRASEELRQVYKLVQELVGEFSSRPLGTTLRKYLAKFYGDLELNPLGNPVDKEFSRVAGAVDKIIAQFEKPTLAGSDLTAPEQFEIFIRLLGQEVVFPDAPSPSLDIEGWMELSWEDSQWAVIAGMNEGLLPESVVGDVFLPNQLRLKLGLNNNDRRLARDIYLLQAILAGRPAGQVHIICGKKNHQGEALKPSRLLFLCDDASLLQRASILFPKQATGIQEETPGQQPIWFLRPEKEKKLDSLSVTAFRSYLQCPFRFYLSKCLKMAHCDDRKLEIDNLDFGSLAHDCLEEFARDEKIRHCDDESRIRGFLYNSAARRFQARFGSELPLTLMVQMDALQQRLGKAAEIQAEQRQLGWKIIDWEYSLGDRQGVELEGMMIHGRLDRIDQHQDGRIRILDYKTTDTAKKPHEDHFDATFNPRKHLELAAIEQDGKKSAWTNLQLPLYLLLLKHDPAFKHDISRLSVGYFNLPKAVTHSGVEVWEELPDYLEDAERAAEAVIGAIREEIFWPPLKVNQNWDDFAEIFFDEPEKVVEWGK